jgi:hypothetical protein
MKNAVFWDVTPCKSCKTDVWEEYIASIIKVERTGELGSTLIAITDVSKENIASIILVKIKN